MPRKNRKGADHPQPTRWIPEWLGIIAIGSIAAPFYWLFTRRSKAQRPLAGTFCDLDWRELTAESREMVRLIRKFRAHELAWLSADIKEKNRNAANAVCSLLDDIETLLLKIERRSQ